MAGSAGQIGERIDAGSWRHAERLKRAGREEYAGCPAGAGAAAASSATAAATASVAGEAAATAAAGDQREEKSSAEQMAGPPYQSS